MPNKENVPIRLTATLSAVDWDPNVSGWRCPLLRVPGCKVTSFYAPSGHVESEWFKIATDLEAVRWIHGGEAPPRVTLSITLPGSVSTPRLSLWWKKAAIALPPLALILGALVPVFFSHRVPTESRLHFWSVTGTVDLAGLPNYEVHGEVRPPKIDILEDGFYLHAAAAGLPDVRG
jgi:hypothetical protein